MALCYLCPCILLLLVGFSIQHVRYGGEYLPQRLTGEQALLLQLTHSVVHSRLETCHRWAGAARPHLRECQRSVRAVQNGTSTFPIPVIALLTLLLTQWQWQDTHLSEDGRVGYIMFILHSHHNRQTVITVHISKRKVQRFHLLCIAAAQMSTLKIRSRWFSKENFKVNPFRAINSQCFVRLIRCSSVCIGI